MDQAFRVQGGIGGSGGQSPRVGAQAEWFGGYCERVGAGRLTWLDSLRGLAVLLMLLDHVFVFDRSPVGWWLRHTLTRAAFPLFFGIAGYLWQIRLKGSSRRRWGHLVGSAAAAQALAVLAGFPSPDVLVLFVAVSVLRPLIVSSPVLGLGVGLLQCLYLPVPWTGYQPGLAFAWASLGVLAARSGAAPCRSVPGLAWVGRRALGVYVIQMAFFAWLHLRVTV